GEINPSLHTSTSSLNFGSSTTTKSFTIKNTGGGTLIGTISDNRNWISVSSASFSLTQNQSKEITVNVDRSGLSVGTNTGNVFVSSNSGNATVSITATKDDPTPTPPPPDPDPDPLPPDPDPVPTTNTVKFTSSNRILKLTGEFFNDYTTLKIAGGNLVIITKTISNGFEMKVPDNYTKINFLKGNSWYWPGRDGYRLVVDGVKWVEVENEGGWYYLDVGQDPDPLPPPPDPDPDPTPTPTTNTVKFTSSNRILKLTGEFFNDYTKLIIAGGNLILITKTISNGFETTIPNGYTKVNFVKGSGWHYPGKDGVTLVLNGLKWISEGWYKFLTDLPKLAQDSLENKTVSLKNYSLSQNYPNPFNPETLINFSIPSQEFVILKIYNMLGVEIAILVNGLVEKGEHKIIFCDNQLPAGIYFYQIKAGKFSQTRKMIFTK
ncbi:T9SS type A sorting domain-containing protein, partial [Patescibacteria group bacterium]|nr:T9SS type A sorting domain-containing protein [Patescibacteria group bacterium]